MWCAGPALEGRLPRGLLWLAVGVRALGETDPTSADTVASGAGHTRYDLFAPAGLPRGS